MSALSPAQQTALGADRVLITGLVRFAFPGHTVRLAAGSIVLEHAGETYAGEDPLFGTIHAIGAIESGLGDEAPAVTISLAPNRNAAAGDICYGAMQGSLVQMWLAILDHASGQLLDEPLLQFTGEVDTATLEIDAGSRIVTYECVPATERLFDDDEGVRLSPAWHESVWPDEKGLKFVTGVTDTVYWAQNPPNGPKK